MNGNFYEYLIDNPESAIQYRNLFKELLVELAGDALALGARRLELLRRDPDVLHVAAQHEVDLGFDQVVKKKADFRSHPS